MTTVPTNWVDSIGMSVNAAYLNNLGAEVNTNKAAQAGYGTFASRPAASTCPGKLYYCSDTSLVYLSDGSLWKKIRMDNWVGPLDDPPTTGWTAVGSPSIATSADAQVVTITSTGGSIYGAVVRTLSPTSNYSAQFALAQGWNLTNRWRVGLTLRESSSGKAITFALWFNGSTSGTYEISHFSAAGALTAVTTSQSLTYATVPTFMRIRDNGTNLYYEVSTDNLTWTSIYNETRTGYITANQVGIGGDTWASAGTVTIRSLVIV
jgi:hypothetical protein